MVVVNQKGCIAMLNRSDILAKAWANYRRDQLMGLGVARQGPFSRKHFAYCLRMAWAVAKEDAASAKAEADRTAAPVATVLGAVNLLDAVKAARVTQLRNEMLWQEMGDRIDWPTYNAARAEITQLTA